MSVVGPLDAMFLVGESREHPMHVGGLMVFDLPEGAGRDHLARLYREMVDPGLAVNPMFGRRMRHSLGNLGYWSWQQDDEIDLEYHVRLSALARPGRVRELFELTSRLHGTLLDRHRPLWEMHLIEGVQGRRFAVYSKVHHAMLDGVSALRWMQATLTDDPARRHMPATYALPSRKNDAAQAESLVNAIAKAGGGIGRALTDLAGLTPTGLRGLAHTLRAEHAAVAFQAPKTIFNRPITGARRFAAQSRPIERLSAVRASTGATLNDVMLAMCAGALRNYLLDLNALPDKALTAMVPVSIRGPGDTSEGGNSLATLWCDLATDEPDPERRMRRVSESTKYAKGVLSQLTPLQNLMIGAFGLGSAGLGAVMPGVAGRTPPPYNLVISNVPGPVDETLYWNGARLRGLYPASIVLNGQALNISVTSYDQQLHFGLVGCRRSVPHLQRLLTHLETSLTELERL
ncbi:wax ester/triacylglycerol synthase family O-acyltransferase [Kribbella sp. NBC_01245]|uniref:WS/DGAT/MGAT family O-acyltransferase n=1 Tax=Kribbella sp. NBC_01245 TaxID=2903578 RepID=UPI002E2C9AA7|nr:wax ester/triacylglycerol synthase family O-acyltransferase [Kribbella sp. NBC_01245]